MTEPDRSTSNDDRSGTIARRALIGTVGLAGIGGLVAAVLGGTGNGIGAPTSAGAAATRAPGHTPFPTPAVSAAPRPTPAVVDHDAVAASAVKRFVEGEWEKVKPYGTQPLAPRLEGDAKVFDMSITAIQHRLDALKEPTNALGFNGTWPGPTLRVVAGDLVRATFKNDLSETTGVHFHGQRLPNKMDGVPLVTQDPIKPGGSFTYEFVARTTGSHMYHSHHNATDQVGRGLLGAFIVDPKDPAERPERKYGVTQDIVWISNDTLGGFTINGRGFPATKPIVAKLGERIYIRFMNEGVLMHPWHLHGTPMHVVARDGYPLGSAAFTCDTLGVNPGERWDVVVDCDEPGVWAFHCHILPHAEGHDGMFGMVTALIVS
ncbi:MAG TPA: multicopper oxidase domain-containing protein [Candidatus Limnocylindria bacterium]